MPDGPDPLTDLFNLSTNRPVALLTSGPADQTPLLLIYPLLPTQAPHTSCVQAHMVGYSCSSFTHSITWSTHSHHTHLHLSFTHGPPVQEHELWLQPPSMDAKAGFSSAASSRAGLSAKVPKPDVVLTTYEVVCSGRLH